MPPEHDGISNKLTELHDAYKDGRLRILVGAGLSMQAGFPSWATLEQNLLRAYLKHEFENSQEGFLRLLLPALPRLGNELHAQLGQGATDLVWKNAQTPARFFEMLAFALYEGRPLHRLPIKPLARQVAAMADALIFTTNYDPLLEIAMSRVRDGILPEDDLKAWRKYVGADAKDEPKPRAGFVYHLHGLIEPNGRKTGECVLTEEHYFNLTTAENAQDVPNQRLLSAMDGDGVLLIVGMSLADQNLKRILFQGKRNGKQSNIYAVLREEDELVQLYQQLRWKDLGVQLIWVNQHEEIEGLLRQVKYGGYQKQQPPAWVDTSIQWLDRCKLTPELVFSEAWQRHAAKILDTLRAELMLMYPQSCGEEINLNFLLPMHLDPGGPRLHLVSRTGPVPASSDEARKRAELHSFAIKYKGEGGSSGAAFVSGRPDNTGTSGQDLAHRNIDAKTKTRWRNAPGFRDWRSILSVPMSDSPDWVPVSILSITSNFAVPFWERFGEERQKFEPELKAVIRGAMKTDILGNIS